MRGKILLVEDEALIAMSEARMLEKHGFEPITVYNGEAAVETVREDPEVSLVLMDIELGSGGMDGTEAAEQILGLRDLPIVFLTSHEEKEYVDRVKGITGYGYVLKNAGEFVLIESINMAYNLYFARGRAQPHLQEGEEKPSYESLRETRDFLDAVFHSIQDGISVLDPDLTIRYTNPVMEQWYPGSTPLRGKKCYAAYHNGSEPCSPCPSLRCMESGKSETEIVPGSPDPDSPVKWLELFSYPLKDTASGKITGVIEFVRDITARVETEQKLRESEARWQFALEGAGDGVWDWNAKTGRVYFSPRWKEMLGYGEEEIGESVEEWKSRIHPDDRERCFRDLEEHLRGNTPSYRNEHRLRDKQGRYKWILDRGKVIERDDEGNPLRVIGTHTDITERKETEQQLEQALREKNELMRELNHRVKNNLAMISSLISLKDSALSGQLDLSDLKHQIDAIRIVHEKLVHSEDISHIELRSYFQDLLETIFSSFSSRQVYIDNDTGGYSLQTRTAIPLGLIVNEVATNAIKHGFTAEEEARFSVRLMREEESGHYVLSLSNSGSPFPEEIDIHRADSLGLQLIVSLAGQLGGSVELSKRPSPTFTIRFSEAPERQG